MRFQNSLRLLLVLVFLVSGCAQLSKQTKSGSDWAAGRFYQEGHKALEAGDYDTAIEYFNRLQDRYPSDRNAPQAQLEISYAYYKKNELDKAVIAADRYIRWYPEYPHVDYAYYLKGLSRYRSGIEALSQAQPKDDSRDTTQSARQSFQYFAELTRRFPNSAYTEDALQRMMRLRNRLAGFELAMARSELASGDAESAAGRAEYIVEHYQHSNAVPQAYALMVRAYQTLGLDELANDALFVLEQKYPEALPALKDDTSDIMPVKESGTPPTRMENAAANKDKQDKGPANPVVQAAPEPVSEVMSPVEEVDASSPPKNLQTVSIKVEPAKASKPETVVVSKPPPEPLKRVTIKIPHRQSGLKDEDWLMNQDPAYYTVQLLGVDNSKAIIEFVDQHHIQDHSAFFHSSRRGNNWFSLVYGLYEDHNAAQMAISELPKSLREARPWVRRIRDVQSIIRKNAARMVTQ